MAELDNLQIKISADTLKAISAINKLNNSLEKLKDTASSSGAGFKTLAKQTNMFCDAIKGNIRTLERYAAAMQKISNSTNRRVPKAPTKSRKSKADKVPTPTPTPASAETPKDNQIPKLPDQQNAIESGNQGVLQRFSNWFKKFKTNADKATKSTSMFVKVLNRMILYMALRTVIQSFLQSINKGADLLYRYAQVTENASNKSKELIATMDRMASNTLKVDAALGSLKLSFSWLQDAWSWIVVNVSNGLSQMMALLKGEETYWTVNTEAVKKYEGALKGVVSQYDELNTLTNTNEVDYSTLLEEKKAEWFTTKDAKGYSDIAEAMSKLTKSTDKFTTSEKLSKTESGNFKTALEEVNKSLSERINKDEKLNGLLTTQENLISKGLPTAMDILNGTSITTPLQSFQTLNAEIQKSIDLTNQLNGKTTSSSAPKSTASAPTSSSAPKSTASAPTSSALKSSVKAGGTLLPGMVSLSEYASGGFVQSGEIFVARESGPEMVGTIGGQGAVANNADIVQAIAQGVADAIARGNMTVSVSSFEGGARSLIRSLDNSATLRRLGGI